MVFCLFSCLFVFFDKSFSTLTKKHVFFRFFLFFVFRQKIIIVQSNLVKIILISGEIASKGFSTGIVYFDHAENDYQLSPGRKGEESAENRHFRPFPANLWRIFFEMTYRAPYGA